MALLIASMLSFNANNVNLSIFIFIGTVIGTYGVFLANEHNKANFAYNFISCFFLGIIYFSFGLYSMAFVYVLFLVPMQLQGFLYWSYPVEKNGVILALRKLTKAFMLLGCIVCASLLYFLIHTDFLFSLTALGLESIAIFPAALDTVGAAANVFGQILMGLKFSDATFYWKVVNVSQIALFAYLTIITGGLGFLPLLVMYILWLLHGFEAVRKGIR